MTGTPPTATTGWDNSDLIAAVHALTAATTIALQQQDDDGNTPKMTAANHWLLLWASEMVEQPDEFGIMAKRPFTGDSTEHNCGEGTLSLDDKSLPSAAMAWLCAPATVLAILNGTFVHETTEVGLFSPFAMLPAKAASANPEDFLSLQLKSAEGKGLDTTDIAQTTKSVFYVPTDIHQLAFATVGFVHLVEVIFGTQSVLYWAIHSWTMHMQLNQLAYEEGFSVDAMFGAKILMLIDRRVQNYLKKGYDPATHRMAKTHLSFQVPQNEVVDGEFQYSNIPHNILKAYQKQTSGAAAPRRTGSISVPSDSLPVENPTPLPSLQASEDHLQYLLLSVHNNGPCWGGDG